MGFLTCAEMKALEEAAFERGVSAEALMNEAGVSLGRFLTEFFPERGTAVAYLGRGNNGGDALVALRVLQEAGWRVAVRLSCDQGDLGELPRRKWAELGAPAVLENRAQVEACPGPLLLLDGLLGIGAKGALREPLRGLAEEMNQLRRLTGARVAAVDIPTGVDADTGEVQDGAVQADVTCVIAAGKPGLVRSRCLDHVGRISLIALAELTPPVGSEELITATSLRPLLPRRAFDTHKGEAGRVGIIAGSPGFLGAAVLCAQGALRGGAGLVTLYVPRDHYPLMVAAAPPPEVMIKPVDSFGDALADPLDALALGPGIGGLRKVDHDALLECVDSAKLPVVLDADGLNLVARVRPGEGLGANFLLTPHPGEMARLLPGEEGTREHLARTAVDRYEATVLFKGARTLVTAPGEGLCYNTTGTPGMATGGQGDLLTGLLAALLARRLDPLPAACAGAWLAGRAGELALTETGQSEESLTPSDVAERLGSAFCALRRGF